MSATRVLRGLVLGALGGFVGWVLVEPVLHLSRDPVPGQPLPPLNWWSLALLAALVGACIGAALGVAEGIQSGTRTKFQLAVILGALCSAVGGWLGLWFGQQLFTVLLKPTRIGEDLVPQTSFQFFVLLVARTLGWMLFGALVGLSVGIPAQSPRKLRHGLIGGMLGGALGGFSFETLGTIARSMPLFEGPTLRLIGFTSIGAATGFFVSLVSEAFKQAWVKVLVGRNEGREHILDKPENVIGRDELVEVPVFGDTAVARRHAVILESNGRHVLRDEGASGGTQLNGQPVTQQMLQDGDRITVGRVSMIFYEKATASPYRRPVDVPSSPTIAPPPMAGNVCPYCGTPRDPVTGACACTVAPDAAPGVAAAPQPLAQSTGLGAWPPASAAGAGARLVGLGGPYADQEFPLLAVETTIGRDPGRDVPLTGDPTTSRRHAVIVQQNGRYLLRDEGSSNGTFVNGIQITEQPLQPGDEIRIGGSQFRFEA